MNCVRLPGTMVKNGVFILSRLRDNWRNIEWWHAVVTLIFYKRIVGNKGVYIMEKDWDNLIILDACRYDLFKEVNNIPGILEFVISRGSHTGEFLRNNFKGRKYADTVYVTANPLVDYHVRDCFHEIVSVWKDGWSDEYETVLPKTMVEYALEADKKYPHKRLIIHFVQPHYPFLGEKYGNRFGREYVGMTRAKDDALGIVADHGISIWDALREGKFEKETVWDAYKENLQLTLPYVKELVDKLRGKTVISADHGNLFGERVPPLFLREYGHSSGIYAKNLVEMPWLVIESKDRKQIIEATKNIRRSLERKRIKDTAKRLRNRGKI